MKTSFLITTVTAALLAGTSFVSAQKIGAEPKQDQKASPSIQMKSQDRVQNNAQDKSGQAAQNNKAAQDKQDKKAKDKVTQDKAKDKVQPSTQKAEPASSVKETNRNMSKRITRRGYGAYAQAGMQAGMYDRYSVIVNNRVIGRDPDPRIRFELRRDDPARRG